MRTEISPGHGPAAVQKVLEAELRHVRDRGTEQPQVVDVGAGSGVWAVPFASAGCLVTVVEPNPDALATLQRRAAEAGVSDQITMIADDSEALGEHVPADTADLVLAHAVLEVVDDPVTVVTALARAAAPDGAVSVLTANHYAAVLHRALTGRLAEARRLLAEPDGVLHQDSETLLRRFDPGSLEALLTAAGLDVTLIQGDGVVADLVSSTVAEPVSATTAWEHDLTEFEAVASAAPPLRDIASRLHALSRKPHR